MFEAPSSLLTAASRQCMSYVFSTAAAVLLYFEVCLGFAKGPPFLCTTSTTFYNHHRIIESIFIKKKKKLQNADEKSNPAKESFYYELSWVIPSV